ncbi:MAG: RNA polymerase sigma factor [Chitinophagales bacterium]
MPKQSNCHQAFLQKYQKIHERFTRYCSSRCYGLMETEDLVNETVLRVLQEFKKIKNKDRLLHFMIGVANNIIKNKLRRNKFRGTCKQQAFERLESKFANPEIALDVHLLYKALSLLPEQQKEAILLFEINGFSMKEISEIQQASLSATKTRISRGRQKLKVLLNENHPKTAQKVPQLFFTLSLL